MATVANTVRITGPAEAVFDLVTTARFWPQWHPASQGVAGVTQRPYQLGDVVHERGEIAGIQFQVPWKVAEHTRPKRVVLQTPTPPARIIYTFEARREAIEFRREVEYDEAAFRAAVADPAALGRLMHAQSEEALRHLKELIEGLLHEEAAGFTRPAGPPPAIRGVHTMFYTSQPEALRAFLRDKLGLPYTDVGEGWLIFDLPEAEMGCHPAAAEDGKRSGTHDISFYCDDIERAVADLRARGVEFTAPVADHGYGLVTYFKLPGDFQAQLYQPRYRKGTSGR